MKTFIQKEIAEIRAAKLTKARERKYIAQFKRRGFSNMDLWSLDNHLSRLIYDRLVEYFKTDDHWPRHGWPDPKDPSNKIAYDRTVAQARRQREDVLWAFKHMGDDTVLEYGRPEGYEPDDKARARMRANQARCTRGIRIFCHNFQSLWT